MNDRYLMKNNSHLDPELNSDFQLYMLAISLLIQIQDPGQNLFLSGAFFFTVD